MSTELADPDDLVRGTETQHIPIEKLLLDPENPRLNASTGATQEAVRKLLVANEEVIALANDIVKNGGLLPTDRIVVVQQRSRYVVLEGNRRTCACQLILDPGLLAESERGRLRPSTQQVRDAVASIDAVVVPDRETAMKLIATRHTKRGVRPWRPAAKSRFVGRLYQENRDVAEISDLMGMSVSQVKRALLDYHLLNIAKRSTALAKHQREALADLALKTNAFTRFFTLKEGRRYFPTSVADSGALEHPGTTAQEFSTVVGSMAKLYLVPRQGGGQPEYDTRSSASTAIAAAANANSTVRAVVDRVTGAKSQTNTAGTKLGRNAPKVKFFEGFSCPPTLRNAALINVANEIAKIPYRTYSISATFLARSLIEQVLQHCIVHANLQREFYAKCGRPGFEPGLAEIVDFVADKKTEIFLHPSTAAQAVGCIKKHKPQMDKTVHGTVLAAQSKLEEIAADTRVFLERILNGQELK